MENSALVEQSPLARVLEGFRAKPLRTIPEDVHREIQLRLMDADRAVVLDVVFFALSTYHPLAIEEITTTSHEEGIFAAWKKIEPALIAINFPRPIPRLLGEREFVQNLILHLKGTESAVPVSMPQNPSYLEVQNLDVDDPRQCGRVLAQYFLNFPGGRLRQGLEEVLEMEQLPRVEYLQPFVHRLLESHSRTKEKNERDQRVLRYSQKQEVVQACFEILWQIRKACNQALGIHDGKKYFYNPGVSAENLMRKAGQL